MAEYSLTQNSFAGGAVDPLLFALVGSAVYQAGLSKCVNFIPDSRGYLFRRPGTKFAGLAATGTACLIRTLRTPDGPLVVVFLPKQIYLFPTTAFTDPIVLATDYEAEDLASLNIAEFQSAFYITHRSYPPCRLWAKSVTGYNAKYDSATVKEAPYSALGTPDATLSEGSIYLTGDWKFEEIDFDRDDIGEVPFTERRSYPGAQCFKAGRWLLGGSINEPTTIRASRSLDAEGNSRFMDFTLSERYFITTYQKLVKTTTYESAGSSNIVDVDYENTSGNTTEPYDSTKAYPEVNPDPVTTSVMYKADGTTTTLETERIKLVETTITETYTMSGTVNADHAIELIESDMYGSRITWMVSHQRILAGTKRAIWMDSGEVLTPSTFDMAQTLGTATAEIQPEIYGSFVFFVSADRRSVRYCYYDSDAGGYKLGELSQTAKHLFTSNIKSIAVMEGALSILWVLLEEGKLLSCTLTNETFGWAEHILGGETAEVRAMCAYHADADADTLFLMVDRGHATEAGEPIMYLESLDFEDLNTATTFSLLDGAVTGEQLRGEADVELAYVNAHEFVEGDKVQMVSDGWPTPVFEYTGENVTSPIENAVEVYVGFPVHAEVQMLRQELPAETGNTSIGKRRKALSSSLQVYRSAGGNFGYENLEVFQTLMKMGYPSSTPPELFTGLVNLDVASNVSEEPLAIISTDDPLPLTILSITTKYAIKES